MPTHAWWGSSQIHRPRRLRIYLSMSIAEGQLEARLSQDSFSRITGFSNSVSHQAVVVIHVHSPSKPYRFQYGSTEVLLSVLRMSHPTVFLPGSYDCRRLLLSPTRIVGEFAIVEVRCSDRPRFSRFGHREEMRERTSGMKCTTVHGLARVPTLRTWDTSFLRSNRNHRVKSIPIESHITVSV